jgi:hypothetical protein
MNIRYAKQCVTDLQQMFAGVAPPFGGEKAFKFT